MTAAVPPTATPDDSCALEASAGTPIHYDVVADIDAQTHSAVVSMALRYRNETGRRLERIVLNVDPNRTPETFLLDTLTVSDESPVTITQYALNGARLTIAFSRPLAPGCTVALRLRFSVRVPPLSEARVKYFAYTDRQMNLGFWLPEVAPFIDGEWRTPRAWGVGEYVYSELADFDVRASVQGGRNLEIIGPGDVTRPDDRTWTFTLRQARTFTLAVSNAMSLRSTRTADGMIIDLYYFTHGQPATDEEGAAIDGPGHALRVAREAAELFRERFGPIPFSRLVVIEGDFPDGMEFSGMVYVSEQWFTRFNGRPASWLTLITAHEVAHQWWYVLVSNDQGEAPYLDEALAIYCELLYLERYHPGLVSWWWNFRVERYRPEGFVDAPVYEYWNVRLYINAIYLRGASMLQEIRDVIGDEAFFRWLRDYVTAGTARIVTPADFWGAMRSADYARTGDIRARYLRNTDPLHTPSVEAATDAAPSATDAAPSAADVEPTRSGAQP